MKLEPVIYHGLLKFDAPNGSLPGIDPNAPPPVPEQGTVGELNLAFLRIQILNQIASIRESASGFRFNQVTPNISRGRSGPLPPSESATRLGRRGSRFRAGWLRSCSCSSEGCSSIGGARRPPCRPGRSARPRRRRGIRRLQFRRVRSHCREPGRPDSRDRVCPRRLQQEQGRRSPAIYPANRYATQRDHRAPREGVRGESDQPHGPSTGDVLRLGVSGRRSSRREHRPELGRARNRDPRPPASRWFVDHHGRGR